MKFLFSLLLFTFTLSTYGQKTLAKQLQALIRDHQAVVGIAVSYEGKFLATVNNTKGYPMMSTFKFPLAISVLQKLEQEKLPLETELFISSSDLHPNTYSPLRNRYPTGDIRLSISELLKYTIVLSDNNACDILLQYVGGPETVQHDLRQWGIQDMQIIATEDQMHQTGDPYLNHTRPSAAVRLLDLFISRQLLSPVYHDFLEKTMIATTTGADKLKGLLPEKTVVGHKTGSSDRSSSGIKFGDNDMGFVYLPNGKRYTIAVFIMDSSESDPENARLIARISQTVYDYCLHNTEEIK